MKIVLLIEKLVLAVTVFIYFTGAFFLSAIGFAFGLSKSKLDTIINRSDYASLFFGICAAACIAMLISSYKIIFRNRTIKQVHPILLTLVLLGSIAAGLFTKAAPAFAILLVIVAYVFWYGYRNDKKT